jgi:hypothetical protein
MLSHITAMKRHNASAPSLDVRDGAREELVGLIR